MLILQKQQQMFVPLFAIHDQIHLRKELIKYRDTNHSQAALGGWEITAGWILYWSAYTIPYLKRYPPLHTLEFLGLSAMRNEFSVGFKCYFKTTQDLWQTLHSASLCKKGQMDIPIPKGISALTEAHFAFWNTNTFTRIQKGQEGGLIWATKTQQKMTATSKQECFAVWTRSKCNQHARKKVWSAYRLHKP